MSTPNKLYFGENCTEVYNADHEHSLDQIKDGIYPTNMRVSGNVIGEYCVAEAPRQTVEYGWTSGLSIRTDRSNVDARVWAVNNPQYPRTPYGSISLNWNTGLLEITGWRIKIRESEPTASIYYSDTKTDIFPSGVTFDSESPEGQQILLRTSSTSLINTWGENNPNLARKEHVVFRSGHLPVFIIFRQVVTTGGMWDNTGYVGKTWYLNPKELIAKSDWNDEVIGSYTCKFTLRKGTYKEAACYEFVCYNGFNYAYDCFHL